MDDETRSRAQAVAVGGVAIVLTYFAIQLIIVLRVELAVLFLGFVIGITLAPLTEYGERVRIPRILSVLLVYAVIGGLIFAFVWWSAPVLAEEAVEAAAAIDDLQAWYEGIAEDRSLPPIEELLDWGRDALSGRLAGSLDQALAVFGVLLYFFMVLVIALFVTITKDRMYDLTLSLIPMRRREAAGEFLQRVAARLRGFVIGELLTMFAVGVVVYIGLTIIGIPLAPLLAAVAFLFELVPILGPWAAFLPAFMIALSEGVWHAVAVAVLYLIVQQLENHVLVPAIQSRSVQLPGLLIVSAVLVGFPLLGLLGAFMAIPIAVIIYSVVHDLLVPWRQRQVEVPLTGDEGSFRLDRDLTIGPLSLENGNGGESEEPDR